MNTLNKSLAGLLIATMASCTSVSTEQAPVTPDQAVRTISFAEHSDGGGNTCKGDASRTRDIWLNHENDGCENDEMSYFKLDNVRSAVLINLESRDCDDSGGWVFVLKTYIDPISTEWLSISSLKGEPNGAIISRGVMKVEGRNEDQDDITGKLSCARIRVSDLP